MLTHSNSASPITQTDAALLGEGWRKDAFNDIAERLSDPKFPCIFSRNAHKKGLVRFLFVETIDEEDISRMALGLRDYVHEARQWDGSLDRAYPLVVIFGVVPAGIASALGYHHLAWSILSRLTAHDAEPWPSFLPLNPESTDWSMCFAGMPLFCNISSPAHQLRRSRNLGRHLTIVINPRERFDHFAGDTVSGRNTRKRIRARVAAYDLLEPSPALATYGAGQLEWKQYGLHEDNLSHPDISCPFQLRDHVARIVDGQSLSEASREAGRDKREEDPPMELKVICSNARVGDRAAGLVEGARLTARELHRRTGVTPLYVGAGSTNPVDDNWPQAIEDAHVTLTAMQQATDEALSTPGLAIFANNTCSVSIATLPIAAQRLPDLKVLWIDAHGDYNTPDSTQTGYLGGMALAATTGSWDSGYGAGVKPTHVKIIGARDVDEIEHRLIATDGIGIVAPGSVSPAALREFVGDDPVWVHIDWDVLEPGRIPADYEVPNGLVPQHVSDILAALDDARLIAVELAEFQASPRDSGANRRALDCILDIVSPLIDD